MENKEVKANRKNVDLLLEYLKEILTSKDFTELSNKLDKWK